MVPKCWLSIAMSDCRRDICWWGTCLCHNKTPPPKKRSFRRVFEYITMWQSNMAMDNSLISLIFSHEHVHWVRGFPGHQDPPDLWTKEDPLVISWLNSKPLQLQMFFRYIYIYIYTYHISYINPSDFSLTYKSIDDHKSKINPHVGWWHTHFCGWNPLTPTSFSPIGAHRAPIVHENSGPDGSYEHRRIGSMFTLWFLQHSCGKLHFSMGGSSEFIYKCVIFHSSRKELSRSSANSGQGVFVAI